MTTMTNDQAMRPNLHQALGSTAVVLALALAAGCASSNDTTTVGTAAAVESSQAPTTITVAETQPAATQAAATTVAPSTTEERTGAFNSCPEGKELRDRDGDGWGTCNATTTTTSDPTIAEGTYVVGAEIQPGIYRVSGYWARLDAAMEIIDNDGVYDNGVGLMKVEPTDAYVEISGAALPLGETRTLDPVVEGFTEGTYLVNWDIQPGRYRITPTDRSAYFARLDETGDIIDNNISDGQVIVIVDQSDWALTFDGKIEPMP